MGSAGQATAAKVALTVIEGGLSSKGQSVGAKTVSWGAEGFSGSYGALVVAADATAIYHEIFATVTMSGSLSAQVSVADEIGTGVSVNPVLVKTASL
jgi:hypothetical protein